MKSELYSFFSTALCSENNIKLVKIGHNMDKQLWLI